MRVPEPLRYVFDKFPLMTYPIIVQDTTYQANQFHFVSCNSSPSSEPQQKFCLAVHNVKLVDINGNKKYLPVDPFSLAASLILCYRHHLLLPSEGNQQLSRHTMKLMSYLLSGDNELPALIETRGFKTENITNYQSFCDAICLNYFADDLQAFLFNQFFDNLGDLWILILLSDMCELGTQGNSNLFCQDSEVVANKIANNLATMEFAANIINWASFKIRYPHLFNGNVTKFKSLFRSNAFFLEMTTSLNQRALEATYHEKLQELESIIPLVTKYLKATEECGSKAIIELKLASFVFSTSNFISETSQIGRLLRHKFRKVVQFSNEVLDRY